MSNLLLLVLCLLAGVLLRSYQRVPEQAHVAVNAIILHISVPALTLLMLRHFQFETSQLGPVLMPWASGC